MIDCLDCLVCLEARERELSCLEAFLETCSCKSKVLVAFWY